MDDRFSTVYMVPLSGAGQTEVFVKADGSTYDSDVAISPEIIYHSDEGVFRTVLLHELGHLLGLEHVDDPGSLMFASFSEPRGIGSGELEGIRFLYGDVLNQPEPLLVWADFNKDRRIDFSDFTFFISIFMRRGTGHDLNGNDWVEFYEFVQFAGVFGRRY